MVNRIIYLIFLIQLTKKLIYEKVFDENLEKIKIKNKNYLFVKKVIEKLSEKAFLQHISFFKI